jgi:DNA-binding HxlR family transcriptional regulator
MERKSFERMHCSVAQCLEVIGEWWTMLIVRDAFLGVQRFDELQERLGIARNVLAQRLAKLVDAGVLEKRAYQENPPRYDYVLTDKGRDLWPVLTTMRQWGDRHAAPGGAPLEVVHRACGHAGELVLTCAHCHQPVSDRDVQRRRGPGARGVGPLPKRREAADDHGANSGSRRARHSRG